MTSWKNMKINSLGAALNVANQKKWKTVAVTCLFIGSSYICNVRAEQNRNLDPFTYREAKDPTLVGSYLAEGQKSRISNPIIEVLKIALEITPEDESRLRETGDGLKQMRDKRPTVASQTDQESWEKRYGEKSANIEMVFSGVKHDRLVDLMNASLVYHMPSIVGHEEVHAFVQKISGDASMLSSKLGLTQKQSARLNEIFQSYFLGIGHTMNDIGLVHGYVDHGMPGGQDPINKLHQLVNEVKTIKTQTINDLNSILSKQQTRVVGEWMGWTLS